MKVTIACFLCLLVGVEATQLQTAVSPVFRVVKLLQSLADQIETEGKKEEDLYETFVCWGKSVISQKTETNAAAQSRIDELETYISDLDSGKIELTTERVDLEKEQKELQADLDAAKALREKEKKEFDAAKDEMSKAITALNAAIKVLKEATKDNKKGALMAFRAELNGGLQLVEAESANLNKAVELGQRYLSAGDAFFLQRLLGLGGDVPKRDEKKLRRKADFKMAYKTRSGNIQKTLDRLVFMFKNNLKEAEGKEKDAKEEYEKLSKSKGDQLKAVETALKKMEGEGAARGMSKANAEDEVKALKKQVTDDKKFIKQTEDSLKLKKKEWDARTKLRDGELGAISKAINILYNDDARDNFKKSYASQGFFLQESSTEALATFGRAATALKQAARRSGDRRLSDIASLAAESAADPSAKEKFKPVIKAIDKMLKTLADDEKKDLETKQSCEKDRMDDTRKALLGGKDMDEKTDAITQLESEIEELKESIKKLKEKKAEVKKELEAATKIRDEENKVWKVTDKEDAEAADTVKDATKVLKSYYDTAFKSKLLQVKSHVPKVVEGEAPPPPPATWEGSYGGKKGESTGIIAILEMVEADIRKDQKKAKAEEDEAKKEYDTFKKESEAEMKELQEEADKQDGIKGKKETKRTDTIKERKTKFGEWEGLMKKIQEIAPNCEYYAVNYKMRVKNRQIEIDGLNKAKAILQGGTFKLL